MAKKKKQDFDVVENNEQTQVTLDDFVIPAKIEAFCNQYAPQDHWSEGCDMFTDYQLRSYFKAVVTPLGDPLALYIAELGYRGFRMKTDESGEPVIYCKPK
ncbi:MAG TPA: hypothetical protein DDW28_05025 [Prevotella sp.]|nr:hypothetical protein [uncultured Prevotella sp.]HBF05467.1 hypothetical protein [Candidatus Segatella violae]